jgi:hypothetical protein
VGFVLQIFFQCAAGNEVNTSRSSAASRSMVSTLTDCRPSIPAITPSCSRTCAASGWAKIVRHHLRRTPRDLRQNVAQEVHPTALPGRAHHDRGDGLLQAGVGIGDDKLHPTQPAVTCSCDAGIGPPVIVGSPDAAPGRGMKEAPTPPLIPRPVSRHGPWPRRVSRHAAVVGEGREEPASRHTPKEILRVAALWRSRPHGLSYQGE